MTSFTKSYKFVSEREAKEFVVDFTNHVIRCYTLDLRTKYTTYTVSNYSKVYDMVERVSSIFSIMVDEGWSYVDSIGEWM